MINFIWYIMGGGALGIGIYLLILGSKNSSSKKEELPQEEWVERHKRRSREYSVTHKHGTRVVAESKNGDWKEGNIIGEHDWALFTFFFTIKFDDGEIIKQEERKVTKID